MSADKNNIEEIFKSTFENFESNVDASVWQNIQSNISAGSPSSSGLANSAGQTAMKSIVKWAAAVGVGGTVAVGSYFYFAADNETAIVEKKEIQLLEETNIEKLPEAVEPNQTSTYTESNTEESVQLPEVTEPKETNTVEHSSVSVETSVDRSANETVEQSPVAVETTAANRVKQISTDNSSKEVVVEKQSPAKPEKTVLPKARISASVTKGKSPLEVTFENKGTTGRCSWFVKGTGIQMESNKVEHVFETAGNYWVILAVEDNNNQLAMDSVKITVEADYYIACPKVLTPNGDGSNDTWEITTENVSELHWFIINRAGQKVFEWDSLDGFWDGRDKNGNVVPSGSYFYVIEGKTLNGEPISPEKGVINLFK